MRSYPGDLTAVVLAVAGALVLMVVLSRLLRWYRLRALRLCLLTGTRPQRAALWLALAPVVREFLPLLDKTGQPVRAIVLVPTLSGSDGEPLVAEVEQIGGSGSYIIRLAHRLGGAVRQPDEVAGVLAEDLLYLYRHGAYGCRRSQRDIEKACWPKWAGHPAAECGTKRSRGDHRALQGESPRP